MGRPVSLTTDTFIKRAQIKHGDRYNYSVVDYINSKTKVKIICKNHGEFEQIPYKHLSGQRCPKCVNKNIRYTTEEWIDEVSKIHNYKYDYSKVNYKTQKDKVLIICPTHGEFKQIAHDHKNGCGCPKCGDIRSINKRKKSNGEYIKKAKSRHGLNFTYDKTNYINKRTKIIVTCKIHGDFEVRPDVHLKNDTGSCKKCAIEKDIIRKRLDKKEYIAKAKVAHNNKYDYNDLIYTTNNNKVKIFCKKCESYFYQIAGSHLQGAGCPKCRLSKGEEAIEKFLKYNNINYITQKTFKKLSNLTKGTPKFDFYLPEFNLCIEYQGKQHYISVKFWGGDKGFIKRVKMDQIKFDFCKKENIRLLEIAYWDLDKIEEKIEYYL